MASGLASKAAAQMFGGVVGAPGLGLELHLHVGVDAAGVDGGYPDYAAFFFA